MGKLIYSAITSLDGFVAEEDGNFDWAVPDEEVHAFVNDLERPIGTYLYGRRMYEVMLSWESEPTADDAPLFMRDFADIWRAADKIVYSKRLAQVSSARTRIEREFDPESVGQMKATATRDISVGGPALPRKRSRPAWSTSTTCSYRPSSWEAECSRFRMAPA